MKFKKEYIKLIDEVVYDYAKKAINFLESVKTINQMISSGKKFDHLDFVIKRNHLVNDEKHEFYFLLKLFMSAPKKRKQYDLNYLIVHIYSYFLQNNSNPQLSIWRKSNYSFNNDRFIIELFKSNFFDSSARLYIKEDKLKMVFYKDKLCGGNNMMGYSRRFYSKEIIEFDVNDLNIHVFYKSIMDIIEETSWLKK